MIFLWAIGLIASMILSFTYGTVLFDKATDPKYSTTTGGFYLAMFALFIAAGSLAILGFGYLLVTSLGSLWV